MAVTGTDMRRLIKNVLSFQIGSYFGSVLCSVDVNGDSVTDVLLVGAPMFMNELKKEEGRVYMFSVRKVHKIYWDAKRVAQSSDVFLNTWSVDNPEIPFGSHPSKACIWGNYMHGYLSKCLKFY